MAPDLQFSVIADSGEFESLRDPWTALWRKLPHPNLFVSFDWCWNAWRLVSEPRGKSLRLVIGRSRDRIVVIWPLMLDHGVLRMLSSETMEYRDILVDASEDVARCVDQAWAFAVSSIPADVFVLQNLRQPNALNRKVAELPSASPVAARWCPVIRLDRYTGWDEFAARLPKSLVSDQRRQWKRIRQALPGISFKVLDRPETIEPIMDWITHHKLAWAAARANESVWFRHDDKRQLLRAVANWAMGEGSLVLAVLSDGDTIVSAGWGYALGDGFLFHAFAYDAAYGTYSPSRLFLERLIQHCMARGLRTFDLMPGDEAYKRVWATDHVQTDSYAGYLNRRGWWWIRLVRAKGSIGAPVRARRLFRMLPGRVQEYLQRQLQAYRLVDYVVGRRFQLPVPATSQRDSAPDSAHQ